MRLQCFPDRAEESGFMILLFACGATGAKRKPPESSEFDHHRLFP